MYTARYFMLVLIISLVSSVTRGNEAVPRNMEITRLEKETNILLDVQANDQILILYADGRGLNYPFRGLIFPDDTKEKSLKLALRISSPEKNTMDNGAFLGV